MLGLCIVAVSFFYFMKFTENNSQKNEKRPNPSLRRLLKIHTERHSTAYSQCRSALYFFALLYTNLISFQNRKPFQPISEQVFVWNCLMFTVPVLLWTSLHLKIMAARWNSNTLTRSIYECTLSLEVVCWNLLKAAGLKRYN